MSADELSQEEIDALLNRAAERAREASDSARATGRVAPGDATEVTPEAFANLLDVPVEVRVRLGEAEMPIEDVITLREGSVVALDRAPGDPVDILVNGRLFARGEIVAVEDRFTVRVIEILAPGAGRGGSSGGRSDEGAGGR